MLNQKGSSLLEVMVSVVIFSIVFLALNNVLLISVKASASTQNDLFIQDLTRNALTSQYQKDSLVVESVHRFGKEHFLNETTFDLPCPAEMKIDRKVKIQWSEKDLYRITVITYWQERDKPRTTELKTIMDIR